MSRLTSYGFFDTAFRNVNVKLTRDINWNVISFDFWNEKESTWLHRIWFQFRFITQWNIVNQFDETAIFANIVNECFLWMKVELVELKHHLLNPSFRNWRALRSNNHWKWEKMIQTQLSSYEKSQYLNSISIARH